VIVVSETESSSSKTLLDVNTSMGSTSLVGSSNSSFSELNRSFLLLLFMHLTRWKVNFRQETVLSQDGHVVLGSLFGLIICTRSFSSFFQVNSLNLFLHSSKIISSRISSYISNILVSIFIFFY
jgi:hypothetical protein